MSVGSERKKCIVEVNDTSREQPPQKFYRRMSTEAEADKKTKKDQVGVYLAEQEARERALPPAEGLDALHILLELIAQRNPQ